MCITPSSLHCRQNSCFWLAEILEIFFSETTRSNALLVLTNNVWEVGPPQKLLISYGSGEKYFSHGQLLFVSWLYKSCEQYRLVFHGVLCWTMSDVGCHLWFQISTWDHTLNIPVKLSYNDEVMPGALKNHRGFDVTISGISDLYRELCMGPSNDHLVLKLNYSWSYKKLFLCHENIHF